MLRTRLIAAGAAGLLAAVGLSSCGIDRSGGTADEVVIGYSGYTLSNPFFVGLEKGLKDQTDEEGYKLITTNANGDPGQQANDVQNLVTQGADYILICPQDGQSLEPVIKAAAEKGVKVMSLADSIPSPDLTTSITASQLEVGRAGAAEVVKFLQDRYGEVKGNVVELQGIAGSPAANYRHQAFSEITDKHPGIKVVASQDAGFDTDKAYSVMTDILQANPKIDAVFAANDAEAHGALKAIESAGRLTEVGEPGHIYVGGNDTPPVTMADIRANLQDVSVSQNPVTMAKGAVEYIADLENGGDVKKEIVWPIQVITPSNYDSAEVKKYGIWADEID
ncbi:sugar ABC transporter substrate-binding protein [Aeromicrobium sp. IC_218]|uniref:sugar ABC transporter substrate-binding protein n=1 Tax=Aeromicrobium sp. IC_218 TaxID=2545468 RepID=UPI00103AB34F|nr:sugar ABC transporter substrate-binding protein [Aeromicrobium sp. IC_218]TCI96364.1 D-ribose ABC transporter substrate-binding protein [Aeromicrobium sp. IC_218]